MTNTLTTAPAATLASTVGGVPAKVGAFGAAVAAKRQDLGADTLFLLDVSSSMCGHVDVMLRGKINAAKRRIDLLRRVVADVQRTKPGIARLAFGGAMFDGADGFASTRLLAPGEDIPEPMGGTPLHTAIEAATAMRAGRLVILSDGYPDVPEAALEAAAKHGHRIDAIFIGPDDPTDMGARFLAKLAQASGGNYGRDAMTTGTKQLEAKIVALLGDGNATPAFPGSPIIL